MSSLTPAQELPEAPRSDLLLALPRGEAWFHLMADAIPQIVWLTDAGGRAEFFNRQWSAYTGVPYTPSTAYEIAAGFVHPDDVEPTMEAWDEARREARVFQVEHRIRSAAGEYRWFLARAEPYRDPGSGAVVGWFGTSTDIHDQKRAEQALRESEARQRFLLRLNDRLRPLAEPVEIQFEAARALGEHLRASRVGYAEAQEDGETIVVTRDYTDGVPGIEGRYRYDDYGAELLRELRAGRTVVRPDIAADPTLTGAEKAAHAALQLGATVNVPLLKEGRLVAVLFMHHCEARAWSAEELALLEAVAERTWDAVERARADAAQREAVQRYERQVRLFEGVASTTPDFVYLFDLRGCFLYANRRLLEVWGMELPDVVGRTCRELGYEQWHHDMHMREIAQVIETRRPIKGEVPFRAPLTGFFGVYEYIFTPVLGPDGEVETIAGTTRDITERKQAEEELRNRGEQFRTLVDRAPTGVYLVDADFRIAQVNRVALPAFGGDPEVIGRDAEAVLRAHWPAELADEVVRVHRHTMETGEPYHAHEVAVSRPDRGVTEHYDWRVERITLPDGRHGVVCYLGDISEQVQTRQKIERLLRESEQARAAAEAAGAAAEAANRAKADFLASMSHELRTPLNAIGGYVDLLDVGIHGPLTEAQRQALARVTANQRHLLGLINDVLAFARVESGRIEFVPRPLAAADLLAGVEALVAPLAQVRGIALSVRECDPSLHLRGDEERVRQILLNLVGNAIKFTPGGGWVALDAERSGEWVDVRVRDNGPGISAEQQERVFEPFVQVERRLNSPQEGVGLGLAISRDLARAMGGDLRVESTPGEGSTFTLRLPRTGPPA